MKPLKKALFALITIIALSIQAQNKALTAAFSQSYDHEAIAKCDAAITSIKGVYSDKSYEINLRMGW